MKKHPLGAPSARTIMALCASACLAFVLILGASPVMAEEEGLIEVNLAKEPAKLDKNIEKSIDHLFDLLNDTSGQLDMPKIQPMLDFVTTTKDDPKDIAPKRRFGGKGICLRAEMKSDLDKILRYFYNPNIPNALLCPAVLRLSGWREGSEFLQRPTPLWDELPTLSEPVLVRGKEFEINTPDSFAEAYYKYDLNRLIILLKHNGKNVVVSISEQADKSDVGRKGAILDDKDWDYFYSGLEGLNKGGISWMDTFMYRSGSIQIITEHDAMEPKSSVFLFKWLKAGWASMNVVKRKHIYEGTLRWVRSLRPVLESDTLSPAELAEGMKSIRNLNESEIDALIKEYSTNFEVRFKNDPKLKKKEYAKIIANGGYAEVLDADARKSILALEKLKGMLGMETLIDLQSSPVAEAPTIETPAMETEVQPEG